MGSLNHPRVYDRAAMLSIRAAFHDVVDVLHAQNAFVAAPSEDALKAEIIRRLLELVAHGTTNPEELKAQVLGNLPLR
jgi:hypothetical protein